LGIGFLLAKLQNISELPASFGEKILQKIVNVENAKKVVFF
jgi:hypothetical protein